MNIEVVEVKVILLGSTWENNWGKKYAIPCLNNEHVIF